MQLSSIISTHSAISPRKAVLAYDFVASQLNEKSQITISLVDIEDFTSAFANAFIGKLYMHFDPALLNASLIFEDVQNEIWKYKIENAIRLGSDEYIRENHSQNLSELLNA